MGDLFDLMDTISNWRFLLALIGISLVSSLAAVALHLFARWRRRDAVPVKLRVTSLFEDVRKDGTVMYYPEYLIMSGAYKGQTIRSDVGSNPADHASGDETNGFYNPKSGAISSLRTLESIGLIKRVLVYTSVVAAGIAVFFLLRI